MKKCPYCKTLMNDDVNTCPNCMKDMTNLQPMEKVAPKDNQLSFYSLAFGLIISAGSILAAISQRGNRMNYEKSYDETVNLYNAATGTAKEEYYQKGQEIMANIKTCQYKEVTFYILCGVGIAMAIYALIRYLIKKNKKVK